MDKRMQKIRYEEIMSLVADRDFANAADIADTIEWRDEKRYTTLIKISNLYRLDDQPDKALDLMLMAYDLKPRSKKVVFGLCDLYLDRKDTVKSTEFYKIYEHMAPDTAERLILKYRLVELCNGSVDTLIAILEDMRHLSPSHPEWRYQLAYLYHRTGNVKKCVETCDDIVTWFIKGPFVVKALELKMLHQRLTPRQQEIYDSRNDVEDEIEAYEGDDYTSEKYDDGEFSGDIMVKPISIAKCDTINLSKELAESMAELLAGEEKGGSEKKSRNTARRTERFNWEKLRKEREQQELNPVDEEYYPDNAGKKTGNMGDTQNDYGYTGDLSNTQSGYGYTGDMGDTQSDYGYTGDMGDTQSDYGYTGDLSDTQSDYGYTGDMGDTQSGYGYTGDMGDTQSDYGYTGDLSDTQSSYTGDMRDTQSGIQYTGDMNYTESDLQYTEEQGYGRDDEQYYTDNIPYDERHYEDSAYNTDSDLMYTQEMESAARASEAVSSEKFFEDKTDTIVIDTPPTGTNPNFTGHKAGEDIQPIEKGVGLGGQYYQADDGQFNLAIPFEPVPDKQITGQINISDALENWEKIKQRNDEQIRRETRQAILDTTGPIFERFDRESRDVISREPRVIVKESSSHIFGDMYDTEGIELVDIGSEESLAEEEYAAEEPEAYIESEVDEEVKVNGVSQETHGTTIWKEVDAAIRAEKEAKEAAANAEGSESLAGAVAEGVVDAAGAVAEGVGDVAGVALEGATDVAGAAAEGVIAAGVAAEGTAVAENGLAAAGVEAVAEIAGDAVGAVAAAVGDAADNAITGAAEDSVTDTESAPSVWDEIEAKKVTEAEVENEAAENEELSEEDYNEEAFEEEPLEDEQYDEEYEEEYYEEAYDEDLPYEEDVSLNTSQMEQISDALETDADRIGAETVEDNNDEYIPEEGDEDDFSEEELRIFDHFLYSKKMRRNILQAIDQISLAPYVGNAIITGEEKEETRSLARALLREIQLIDINFLNNHVARVSGDKMNNKDVATVLSQLANGALLIEDASGLFRDTLEKITNVLENTEDGVIVIMIDEKEAIDRMIEDYPVLSGYFNARIDMPPLTDGALVDYAKSYAYKKEYKIDEERAVLALHQRIDELQIGEHNVTLAEVEQIVDDAIARSGRRPVSSFFEILSGKRYDNKEDMIVLKEKDFQRRSGTVA
ncbi:MAG: hypothetical protein K6C99_04330 [Lachnospiraceae bacterium]|nr:hypothetical protein [Lachnospiraceae bacterium]